MIGHRRFLFGGVLKRLRDNLLGLCVVVVTVRFFKRKIIVDRFEGLARNQGIGPTQLERFFVCYRLVYSSLCETNYTYMIRTLSHALVLPFAVSGPFMATIYRFRLNCFDTRFMPQKIHQLYISLLC